VVKGDNVKRVGLKVFEVVSGSQQEGVLKYPNDDIVPFVDVPMYSQEALW